MMIDIELIFKLFLLIIASIGALVVVLGIILIPIVFAWTIKGAEDHNVV
jgi:hypothetical protein